MAAPDGLGESVGHLPHLRCRLRRAMLARRPFFSDGISLVDIARASCRRQSCAATATRRTAPVPPSAWRRASASAKGTQDERLFAI